MQYCTSEGPKTQSMRLSQDAFAVGIINCSADAVDMILNGMSLGFIFDLDNSFYSFVLTYEERRA